jgi:hypothetical protein
MAVYVPVHLDSGKQKTADDILPTGRNIFVNSRNLFA